MPYASPSYVAGANVGSSLFVRITGNNSVIQCVAGEVADGVSAQWTREAPIPGVTPLAAESGESIRVYGVGETCEIIAGAAITAGAELKPDADGKAVPAVATDEYSAVARTAASTGEKVQALIVRGTLPA